MPHADPTCMLQRTTQNMPCPCHRAHGIRVVSAAGRHGLCALQHDRGRAAGSGASRKGGCAGGQPALRCRPQRWPLRVSWGSSRRSSYDLCCHAHVHHGHNVLAKPQPAAIPAGRMICDVVGSSPFMHQDAKCLARVSCQEAAGGRGGGHPGGRQAAGAAPAQRGRCGCYHPGLQPRHAVALAQSDAYKALWKLYIMTSCWVVISWTALTSW
jgi:hypothetical protein